MTDTPTIEALAVAAAEWVGINQLKTHDGLRWWDFRCGVPWVEDQGLLDIGYGGALLFMALLEKMDSRGMAYSISEQHVTVLDLNGSDWHEVERHEDGEQGSGPLCSLLRALHAAGVLTVEEV